MKTNKLFKTCFSLLVVFCLAGINNQLFSQTDTYIASGTWICPAGITSATVQCWGGGGAGGGSTTNGANGGGGGAGGAYATKVVTVVPGTSYTVTVGGIQAGLKSNGSAGNPSWFGTVGTVFAEGGAGGGVPNGGIGSSASSIGTTCYAGGNGANGTAAISGGGGGGAGSTNIGGNASGVTAGTGTANNGGNGGSGLSAEGDGNAGSIHGGGGAGAFLPDKSDHLGGDGAAGYVTITYTPAPTYCTPAPTSVDGTGITNVNMGTINNTTVDESGHYGNYSAMVTNVTQGATVTCNVTFSTGYTYLTKIWVDWNNDADFDDAGEEVYSGTSLATNPTTLVATFTVPAGATLGNHRIRIGGCDSSTPIPCYTGSYGTYEDYSLNVVSATPMVYVSSTVTQPNTSSVAISSNDNEIICIQVVTSGASNPFAVTQFSLNATGSTAIIDINAANSATIFYTGSSSTFATTTPFGSNTPTLANFNIVGSQTLTSGINYFWLVYDVKGTATAGDVIDGQCTSLICNSVSQLPSVTAPIGSRPIVNQVTIGTGTSTSAYPFNTNWGYSRSASLFTAAEVGTPTVITQLAWNISTAQISNIPVKIYLKTTTASVLTADTWANMISGATLVYDATTAFTPAGWKIFNTTDFSYCNDNLIVLCEANFGEAGAGVTVNFYCSTATNSQETWTADDAVPTSTGSVGSSRPNIQMYKSPAGMCSGAPLPGAVAASVNPVCSPASTTLSVTGGTIDCGLTYQWQSSSVLAGPYTDIVGATSSSYIASPTANTYYRRQIICGANSAYTPGFLVSISNTVPTCATAMVPANNATGLCMPVTLSWTAPVNAGCNAATGYDVYLNTFDPPTTLVSSNQAGTTYVAAGLSGGTPYYWKVVPRNSMGPATGCSSLKFTTAAQNYAVLPYSTGFETAWVAKCGTADVAPDQYWNGTPLTGNNSWRRQDVITSTGQYEPQFSVGAYSAEFNSFSATDASTGALDLYINMSPAGVKTLFFDYINPGSGDANDKMDVLLSSDAGATFTTLLSLGNVSSWETRSVDIGTTSATCIIRFLATSDYGDATENTGIDNVRMVLPCVGAPASGTASVDNSTFCSTGSPLLTLTGFELAGGILLQWQSSFSNSPYAWTDIVGGTTAIFSAPDILATTYYRCVVRCVSNVSYSNILTVSKTAQSIISTNSPVPVACNGTALLTATATGGAAINWYSALTGGTPVGTGASYTTPIVTANTTYYCVANSGSIHETGGMPVENGTYQSTSTNYGVIFNVTQQITLNSVTIYPNKRADIIIAYQNGSGVEQWASPLTATNNGDGTVPQVINLGCTIPVGTGYRLVLKTYTPTTTGVGLTYSSATSFPYSSPSGAISVTSGWYGTGTSSSNYHFYNLDISIPCESSPRTPVNVVVTTGVTAPVCASTPVPASAATGICPVGTVISWAASTTACRAATGYKLYLGTDALGTNIYNPKDLGNVTSFNLSTLLGDLAGNQVYNWTIVPYNTGGDATGCTKWSFTTAADPGAICNTLLGAGVKFITLPYTQNNGTTAGEVNDLTSTNLVSCGSTSYNTGEDIVWVFTPTTSGTITVTLASTGTYTGLTLFDGCPLSGGTCGAIPGYCLAAAQDYSGDKTMTACVVAGHTYYLILDSYSTPFNNPFSKLTISAPTGVLIPPNDEPCNATPVTLGVSANGDNSCAGSSMEPFTTPSCWTTGVRNTVWYSVVAPASGQLSVRTSTSGLANTQIALFSGTCGTTMTMVAGACNNDISGCGSTYSSMFTVSGLTVGATYYIAVDGANDLTGSFSVQAIDPTLMSFPAIPGQDCSVPLPTCNNVISVGDPGYSNTGNLCDFSGEGNCTGGERASVWYTINIAVNGTLRFNIIPNDWNSSSSAGDETDYDFLVWRTISPGSVNPVTTCGGISSNSATALVACNYNYLGVTGLYDGGSAPAAYSSSFDAAYEAPLSVIAGEQYIICVSNFTQSTSGFTIDYQGSSPSNIINTSITPPLIVWTGSASTAWSLSANWNSCGALPSCTTSVLIPAGLPRMPVINAPSSVNNLTIDAGATLTINAGFTLSICGNLVNNGTIIASPTSTIAFVGAGVPQAVTGNFTGTSKLGHVGVNNTGGNMVSFNSDVATAGNLTIQSAVASLGMVAGITTTIDGNYSNSGLLTANLTSTVLFNHASNVHNLSGNLSGTSKFGNFTVSKANGSVLIAAATPIEIGGNFTTATASSVFNANNNIVTVGGNFLNNNGNTSYIPGTGTLVFNGSAAQTYTNTTGTLTLNNVTMNHTGTGVTLNNTDMILGGSGTLTLTLGKIITGTRYVIVNNTAPGACTPGNTSSYVEGFLRRYIPNANGSYDFPVGHATKGYQRANFNFTTPSTVGFLTAFFTPYATVPAALGTSDCSVTWDSPAINNGYWTVNANANPSSGRYTCTLYNLNYNNSAGTNTYTVMSDHTAAGTGPWQLLNKDGSNGTCVASTVTQVIRSNMQGFSKFGTAASTAGTLPIDLLSFTGKQLGSNNLLEWITATETNNDYFSLERSDDGVNFSEIAKVAGAGNSNSTLYYSQIDNEPYKPVSYYKLKQVDFNGQYTYSDIVALASSDNSEQSEFISLFPNPSSSIINLKLYSPVEGYVQVEIIDMFGRTLLSKNASIKKGNDILEFEVDMLADGAYFTKVTFITTGNSGYKRFVKQ